MRTRPDGIVMRGLKIAGSEVKSGDNMPTSYGAVTFDKSNWPTNLQTGSAVYLRFTCADVVTISENVGGTAGVCEFAADEEHRFPIALRAASLFMKAATAVPIHYWIEVEV